MKVDFYSKKGEKAGEKEVSADIFGITPNKPLLTQYIYIYRTNQRQGTSKVKGRAEVSGGGVKPWRQKGTGRARHGSIRSPIWRHGGVVHGPASKRWRLALPKRMKVSALKSALSIKVEKGSLKIVEPLDMKSPSAKSVKTLLSKMNLHGKVLFVQKENDLSVRRSLSNLKNVKCVLVENLCTYDLLLAKNVVLTVDALEFLEKKYADK